MAKRILRIMGKCLFLSMMFVLFLMPECILYGISSLMARLLCHIKKFPANECTRRNMRRAFHEKTDSEVQRLHRLYFRTFGDFLLEFLISRRFSRRKMMRRCKFKNPELVREKFSNHRFVACYGGHLANYEYMVCFPLYEPDYGMCQLYLARPENDNSKGAKWMKKIRSRFGAINIPSYSPLKTLLKLNKAFDEGKNERKGYIFGTLSDMDTKEKNPHSAPFLGKRLEVKTGAERIGRKLDMAFLYAHISSPKRGYYEVEFIEMKPHDLDTNPYAYTDEFVRLLENNIRRQPELWLQWGSPRF